MTSSDRVLVTCFCSNGCPFFLPYLLDFFPRVRTPCGHGAQVIVEGREEQSDGGEKNKDNQNNPKQKNHSPQAESPPSCSLSSVLGETSETKTDDHQWA